MKAPSQSSGCLTWRQNLGKRKSYRLPHDSERLVVVVVVVSRRAPKKLVTLSISSGLQSIGGATRTSHGAGSAWLVYCSSIPPDSRAISGLLAVPRLIQKQTTLWMSQSIQKQTTLWISLSIQSGCGHSPTRSQSIWSPNLPAPAPV